MEVRKGYKQTDVGIIPEDWDVKSISSITEIIGGGTPSTTVSEYWNGQISWVSAGDISNANGRYVRETAYHITDIGLASCSARIVPEGTTIIIARGATVGRMAQLVAAMAFNQTCYGLLTTKFLDQDYLYYSMRFSVGSINTFTYGTIFGTITTNSFQEWKLPLPPLSEQRAIAAALSDVDVLLNSLNALIAKNRLIKQGTMQELLTGKKRLPGFSDKWNEKRLGDTATLKARIGWQGLTTAEYLGTGDYYLITGTDFKDGFIDWDNCHYVDEARYIQDKYIQVKDHDVLVTKDGTIGKVALITNLATPATLNSGVFVIRPIEDAFHPEFFYYLLCSNIFAKFLGQLSAGSTINHLYQKDFVSFVYKTPATIEEQTAIAEILSDMDAEISALEQKREKTRLLKQGMMQELLTGRVRLV